LNSLVTRAPLPPLTQSEINDSVLTWMELPEDHGDRLLVAMERLMKRPKAERERFMDMWIAVMEVVID
jgi:hypothetical protein